MLGVYWAGRTWRRLLHRESRRIFAGRTAKTVEAVDRSSKGVVLDLWSLEAAP